MTQPVTYATDGTMDLKLVLRLKRALLLLAATGLLTCLIRELLPALMIFGSPPSMIRAHTVMQLLLVLDLILFPLAVNYASSVEKSQPFYIRLCAMFARMLALISSILFVAQFLFWGVWPMPLFVITMIMFLSLAAPYIALIPLTIVLMHQVRRISSTPLPRDGLVLQILLALPAISQVSLPIVFRLASSFYRWHPGPALQLHAVPHILGLIAGAWYVTYCIRLHRRIDDPADVAA